jgi:carboxymethylenebutenolidase
MSETVKLLASDGHQLDSYVAHPAAEPIAGLVVLQEIYGVNQHIRTVADGYARDGFLAVAPALFDRVERGVELPYEGPEAKRGMAIRQKLELDSTLKDVEAALEYARRQTGKKSGVLGYCFGGLLAWLSATRLHPDVAVGYYAGGIGKYAAESPNIPVQLHFGKLDAHIPSEEVARVQTAHPDVEIYWYDNAGHGFNCEMRASYNAEAAVLARTRALAFLKRHVS